MNTTTYNMKGRDWLWPADDKKLIQVFDQCEDIEQIMPFVKGRQVCVQAGGACGVWPYFFGLFFERVFTFEPHPMNFRCLTENAPMAIRFQAALSDMAHPVGLKLHETEANNAGAWYGCEFAHGRSGAAHALRLDDLNLPACDLIQLDVEGWEAPALRGAFRTVMEFRPVIVIEEKVLPQGDRGNARELVQGWGYTERLRIHRDVIFTCDR